MKLVSRRSPHALIFLHLFAAIGWLVLSAGGFPFSHARFFTNRALPLLLLIACITGLVQAFRKRKLTLSFTLLTLASFWTVAAITAILLFPTSALRPLFACLLAAVVLWLSFLTIKPESQLGHGLSALALLLGTSAGIFVPLSQRAPASSTSPLNEPPPISSATRPAAETFSSHLLAPGARIAINTGEVELQSGRYMLSIAPLLSFISRSPDRCWTNLSPASHRIAPKLTVQEQHITDDGQLWITYRQLGQSVLHAAATDRTIDLTTWSEVPQDTYSHLNSFCQMLLAGHRELTIEFSAAPGVPIEPKFMQYPIGQPARHASLSPGARFEVLQAASAEKGPYTPLAAGHLNRSDPLTLILRDQGTPVASITFFDFASQASTELSPTAGYRIPQNAIEFSLSDPNPTSPLTVFLTLAGTSVGRGWDSVGHKPGWYRNRMQIEWLTPIQDTPRVITE